MFTLQFIPTFYRLSQKFSRLYRLITNVPTSYDIQTGISPIKLIIASYHIEKVGKAGNNRYKAGKK
jgi:hypothetical protein